MSLPSINFLHLTVSEIQPRQTFSHCNPPAHPHTMGENNTPTALKGCGVIKPLMPWSPTAPGPSRILIDVDEYSPKSLEDEGDAQPCCICKKHSPPGLRNMVNLAIVKWAACRLCKHQVHLRFCSKRMCPKMKHS